MITIKRILCPIDFSEFSDHALKYAMQMAAWYDASVHVLHVIPPMPPSSVSTSEASRQLTANNLARAVDCWARPDVVIQQEVMESAEPARCIMEHAEALDADLIITGSHGRTGVSRALLGSVVEALLHSSRTPVLIIPRHLTTERLEHPASFNRVICGVDFGAASLSALAYALSIAEESDANLTVLNVIEMPPELLHPPTGPDYDVDVVRAEEEAARLTKLRALVPEDARDYCTVQTAVMEGGASRQLLRAAEQTNADLIVLGVHGRKALDLAIFGSNSRDLVTRAQCPVLVVPSGPRRHRSVKAAS
jgi:nucleotide-binding universal stress UspA family protein